MGDPPEGRFGLIVLLWVHDGKWEAFERFESRMAELMQRYEGEVELRFRPKAGAKPDAPNEVHFVSFPNEETYLQFLADPLRTELSALRDEAIRRTEVWQGAAIVDRR